VTSDDPSRGSPLAVRQSSAWNPNNSQPSAPSAARISVVVLGEGSSVLDHRSQCSDSSSSQMS